MINLIRNALGFKFAGKPGTGVDQTAIPSKDNFHRIIRVEPFTFTRLQDSLTMGSTRKNWGETMVSSKPKLNSPVVGQLFDVIFKTLETMPRNKFP